MTLESMAFDTPAGWPKARLYGSVGVTGAVLGLLVAVAPKLGFGGVCGLVLASVAVLNLRVAVYVLAFSLFTNVVHIPFASGHVGLPDVAAILFAASAARDLVLNSRRISGVTGWDVLIAVSLPISVVASLLVTPDRARTFAELIKLTEYFVVLYLAGRVAIRGEAMRRMVMTAIVVSAVSESVIAIVSVVAFHAGAHFVQNGVEITRAVGTASLGLGTYLSIVFPLAVAVGWFGRQSSLWRIGVIAMVVALFLSYTRSAWLAALAGLLIVVVRAHRLNPKRAKNVLATLALLTVGAVLMSANLRQRFALLFVYHDGRISGISSRLYLWTQALHFFERSPVLGIGAGMFHLLMTPGVQDGFARVDPHSTPLWLAADLGVVGLAAATVMVYALLRGRLRSSGNTVENIGLATSLVVFVATSLIGNILSGGFGQLLVLLLVIFKNEGDV